MKQKQISLQDYLADLEFEAVNPKDFEYWLDEDSDFQSLIQAAGEAAADSFVGGQGSQEKADWAASNEEWIEAAQDALGDDDEFDIDSERAEEILSLAVDLKREEEVNQDFQNIILYLAYAVLLENDVKALSEEENEALIDELEAIDEDSTPADLKEIIQMFLE